MKTLKEILIGMVVTLILTAVFVWGLRIEPKYPEQNQTEEITVEDDLTAVEPEIEQISIDASQLTYEVIEPEETTSFKALDIPLDVDIQEYLWNKCEETNIDFALILALMDTESEFRSDVVSNTHDYGLMQINKVNHEWLSSKTGAADYLNPYDNIDAGMWLLERLFEKYEEAELVLMAYHFGEGGAKKLWNKGTCTSRYSQAILEKQLIYQEALNE